MKLRNNWYAKQNRHIKQSCQRELKQKKPLHKSACIQHKNPVK